VRREKYTEDGIIMNKTTLDWDDSQPVPIIRVTKCISKRILKVWKTDH
jgi:hypothetical protein